MARQGYTRQGVRDLNYPMWKGRASASEPEKPKEEPKASGPDDFAPDDMVGEDLLCVGGHPGPEALIIQERFPQATFETHHDNIHEYCLSVVLPGVPRGEWYRWAIKQGFGAISFAVQVDLASRPRKFGKILEELRAERST